VLFDRFRAKALEADRGRFISLDVAQLLEIRGQKIAMGVPGSFHADRLRARLGDLETLASQLFGQPITLSVELLDAGPDQGANHEARESSRRRRQEALNSESVNLALEVLEAEIVEIRPLGENR